MGNSISRVYLAVILLYLPLHPRFSGRLEQLFLDIQTFPAYNDQQRIWKTYVSSLKLDYAIIWYICNLCLAASTMVWCISYRMQDATMTTAASTVACLPIISRLLACCMNWHVVSLEEELNAVQYWCSVTIERLDSAFIQTTMLLAAPFAMAAWASFSTLILLGFACHRLPMPICLDFGGVSQITLLCAPREPLLEFIPLSVTSQIGVVVMFTLGLTYVVIHMYYFTMLGVARTPTPPATPTPGAAPV